MTSTGYIKLHRKIQDHPFWTNESACRGRAMIDLILLASHNNHALEIGVQRCELQRGDFAASVRFLACRWKWGIRKTASFLGRLEVDKFMVKKRNGSGNGSPSIYHIENYDLYQGEMTPEGNALRNAEETVVERLGNKTNKGKNGKKEKPSVFWSDFLRKLPDEDQQTLSDVLAAISSTRKTGKVAEGVRDTLAGKLSQYPEGAVLAGCRIYLQKQCAAEGKDEKYLLGIIRKHSNNRSHLIQSAKTQGQLAIEAAERERLQEQLAEAGNDLYRETP